MMWLTSLPKPWLVQYAFGFPNPGIQAFAQWKRYASERAAYQAIERLTKDYPGLRPFRLIAPDGHVSWYG